MFTFIRNANRIFAEAQRGAGVHEGNMFVYTTTRTRHQRKLVVTVPIATGLPRLSVMATSAAAADCEPLAPGAPRGRAVHDTCDPMVAVAVYCTSMVVTRPGPAMCAVATAALPSRLTNAAEQPPWRLANELACTFPILRLQKAVEAAELHITAAPTQVLAVVGHVGRRDWGGLVRGEEVFVGQVELPASNTQHAARKLALDPEEQPLRELGAESEEWAPRERRRHILDVPPSRNQRACHKQVDARRPTSRNVRAHDTECALCFVRTVRSEEAALGEGQSAAQLEDARLNADRGACRAGRDVRHAERRGDAGKSTGGNYGGARGDVDDRGDSASVEGARKVLQLRRHVQRKYEGAGIRRRLELDVTGEVVRRPGGAQQHTHERETRGCRQALREARRRRED
eukprot:6544447-Prymnesium_polylepis.1